MKTRPFILPFFNPLPYSSLLFRAIVLSLLLLGGGAVSAAQIAGLYEAEVPVAGQEMEQRNQAIIAAFELVLIKVTGNQNIARQQQLAPLLSEGPNYVQQYRYRILPAATPTLVEPEIPTPEIETDPMLLEEPQLEESEPEPAEPQRMLLVQFDKNAVNRLLRQQGLPVWGENRPATLVWLSTERAGHRALLAPEMDDAAQGAMFTVGDKRGVPLLMPLMDLEDQSRLQVSDVWGGFEDSIRVASERYGADSIITGRLVEFGPALWRASWTLLMEGDSLNWNSEGSSLAATAEIGVQKGIDMLASRFAPVAGGEGPGRVRVKISGVDDLAGYARVRGYLQAQAVVERIDLLQVMADSLLFSLQVRGGSKALEQGLSLTHRLQPLPLDDESVHSGSPFAGELSSAALSYRLQP